MKKIFKNLILCTFVFVTLFIVTGCSKKSLTAESFKTMMSSKGYKVEDVTSQYSSKIAINKGYIAINSNKDYQIEFYELADDNTAVSMYENNKQIFENSKENASINTNVDGSNFSKYTLTTGGKFKVVCRVENTLLYLNVSTEYDNEVKEILEYLGY